MPVINCSPSQYLTGIAMSKLKQSGDTLIEVLLAIAILSSVLAGSYSITRKSLRIAQASQDRIYGLKLLEGQVEMLRRYREIDSSGWVAGLNTVLTATDSYCFNPNDLLADAGSFKPHSQAPDKCESFGPPEEPSRYKVINTRDATIPASPVYVFRVEWLTVNGGGEEVLVGGTPRFKDKVEYRYKLNAL